MLIKDKDIERLNADFELLLKQKTSYPTESESDSSNYTEEEVGLPVNESAHIVDFDVPKSLPEKEPPLATIAEFYFSSPSQDGSFNDKFRSKVFKPNASMYRFFAQGMNAYEAEFEFISSKDTLTDALNYPERYLDPVCESTNQFKSDSTRIITIQKGKVRLESEKWVLVLKAKIKYE